MDNEVGENEDEGDIKGRHKDGNEILGGRCLLPRHVKTRKQQNHISIQSPVTILGGWIKMARKEHQYINE